MAVTAWKLRDGVYDPGTMQLMRDYFSNSARFAYDALPAPAFVYVGEGYEPLITEERSWLDALLVEAASVGLDLTYQEGTVLPTVPFLLVSVSSTYTNPSNGTSVNAENEITAGSARYPPGVTEQDFDIEFWQAAFRLSDIGGDTPPIGELSGGSFVLNAEAQKAMTAVMLFDTKTYW